MNPTPEGLRPYPEAVAIITSRPFETDPAITALTFFDIDNIRNGEWHGAREDIAAVKVVFETQTFKDCRLAFMDLVEQGWREPVSMDERAGSRVMRDDRAWARWMTAHSRWAWKAKADPDMVVEDWLAVMRLAKVHSHCTPLMSSLHSHTILDSVAREMLHASCDYLALEMPHELMQEVDRLLDGYMPVAVRLELIRLQDQCELESYFVRDGGWLDVSKYSYRVGPWRNAAGFTPLPSRPSRVWNLLSPVFGDLDQARRDVDERARVLGTCTNLVLCKQAEETIEGGEFAATSFNAGEVTITRYPHVMGRPMQSRTTIDAALTMFALRAWHDRRGEYPEELAALVPEYLPRLPIDYADLQPLRYRRVGEGYLLYSIGEDGVDDGGKAGEMYPAYFSPRNADTVFNLARRGPTYDR